MKDLESRESEEICEDEDGLAELGSLGWKEGKAARLIAIRTSDRIQTHHLSPEHL